jgi:hypothetical protein
LAYAQEYTSILESDKEKIKKWIYELAIDCEDYNYKVTEWFINRNETINNEVA